MAFLAQGTERKEGFGALLLELSHGSAEERALRTHLKWTRDACLTGAQGGEGRRRRPHMVLHGSTLLYSGFERGMGNAA